MFETPSLSFVPCRPPGEPGVTRLWQDAGRRFILIFDFLAAFVSSPYHLRWTVTSYNGGAAERSQRRPPSDPHLVLLVCACWCSYHDHAGSRRFSCDGRVFVLILLIPPPSLPSPPRLFSSEPLASRPRCQCQRQPPLVTATVPRRLAILGLHERRDGCAPVRYQTCVGLSRTETRQHCGLGTGCVTRYSWK